MTDLTHYRLLILNFAYRHLHPGDGFAGLIMLKPGFEGRLDHIAQDNLCELLKFATAHVPYNTRSAQGFNDWINTESNEFDEASFNKWVSAITPMSRPTGWEEVDTSNG